MGEREAAEVVLWLALQPAHCLAIAHAYGNHLVDGHLGKAVPEKLGVGVGLVDDRASARRAV